MTNTFEGDKIKTEETRIWLKRKRKARRKSTVGVDKKRDEQERLGNQEVSSWFLNPEGLFPFYKIEWDGPTEISKGFLFKGKYFKT